VKRLTDGPSGIGTRYAFVRTFMGRRMEANNEYIGYEPDQRITFRTTSGPVPLEASYLFEPLVAGTRLTSTIEMDANRFLGLVEPLIAAGLRREMQAALPHLKAILEQRPVASSSQPALRQG
jgi:hypothetical protein